MSASSSLTVRRARGRKSGQVLILLLGAVFFGLSSTVTVGLLASGRSIDDLKDKTKELVTDEAARQRADALYERWKKDGDAYLEYRKAQEDKLLDLMSRHDATRAEFKTLIDELDQKSVKVWQGVVQILMGLRAEIPAKDWQKVFPPPPPEPEPDKKPSGKS